MAFEEVVGISKIDAVWIARVQLAHLLVPSLSANDDIVVDGDGDLSGGVLEADRVIGAHGLPGYDDKLQGELVESDAVASGVVIVYAKDDFDQFRMRTLRCHAA